MSVKQNKAIVRRMVEEVNNKGNVAVVDELLAQGYVGHGTGGREVNGLEGYKQAALMYRTTFPDLHMTLEDMVAEGDKVAWRYTLRATFTVRWVPSFRLAQNVSAGGYFPSCRVGCLYMDVVLDYHCPNPFIIRK
jgi:hypothetical protein